MHHIRLALLLALGAVSVTPAVAETHKPATHPAGTHPAAAGSAPTSIGKFEDWTAATHGESGQTVCYAFTRDQTAAAPAQVHRSAILTVTERASGRDAVAIEYEFPFAPNAAVTVQVDQTALDFYTAQHDAFARDGKAVVAAFQRGSRAIARAPGPKDASVTDTFSLKGFSAAYAAIVKACPLK